ncbi:3569_t:CDS:2 [Acaulospora morrowiae]|uniref:3569_t:CDS:1 n=1 Tax=Acaulospora morrowiae TaxID=94023 RepID=A0A9N9A5A7_9GLOM|nr:3569_t:CDS:2 [Acaulospora morrowiae]
MTETTGENSNKNTLKRNRPGTKLEDAYQFEHVSLEEINSAFALQEYLQSLIRKDKENLDLLVELPPDQDPEAWQYEHLRQLCLELNYLVVQLESECNRQSCPDMKADEWMYLCAAHPTPMNCCAIDYIVHTLDGATTMLNSHKHFPSRISISNNSVKHYQSIARRLYRIFAHAWFHHREVFESFENETFLYGRFMKLSDRYGLVAKNLLIIPQNSAEDSNGDETSTESSEII